MLKSIKQGIFSSPFFPDDENKTRLYRVLNLIILNYWLIFFIATVILILSVHKLVIFLLLLLMAIILLVTEYLKWKDFYFASHFLFFGIWSIISIVYLMTGIPLNDFSLWYIPYLIGVALLLGKKWSYFYTIITLIFVLVHLLLNELGYIIEPYLIVQWYTGYIVFFIGFIQTLSPINLMIQSLNESEDKYKTLSENLEEKVIERTNQLEDANKELQLYAYSLSHDLRNPIDVINGLANLITNNFSNEIPDTVKEMLNKISTNSNRINNLVKDLLQYFSLKDQKLNKENSDMNKIIGEILENYSKEIKDRNIRIKIDNLPVNFCDPLLVTQIWINLISNAIKYTKFSPNPFIKIGSYTENDKIVYFIEDNGIGFDMDKANSLFKPFNRLYNSQEFEGTGIGLSFVNSIISKHQGKIWFLSTENKGATFYFTLG